MTNIFSKKTGNLVYGPPEALDLIQAACWGTVTKYDPSIYKDIELRDGKTLLELAIINNNTSFVERCLKLGYNPNRTSRDGLYLAPMKHAFYADNLAMVKLLEKYGAEPLDRRWLKEAQIMGLDNMIKHIGE